MSKTKAKVSEEKEEMVTPVIANIMPIPESTFQVKDDYYHMIKVDANGKDIAGTDVAIHPNTYNRVFSKLTTFRVVAEPKKKY